MNSIYNKITNHNKKSSIPFHTPGHIGRAEFLRDIDYRFDKTELPNLDSLYECNSAIRETERKIERLYNAKRSLISTGGCTLAIQAMLKLAVPIGGTVIVSRNCHISFINTCALLDITPIFFHTEELINNITECDAVYITSPDYFGRIADIKNISKICKQKSIPLLVDNAHGSHLIFFDKHPLTLGASMTACSAHKTLPVFTGSAFLNIADERYINEAKQAMALFGSTSPSYMTMASIDKAMDWFLTAKSKYQDTAKIINELKNDLSKKGYTFTIGNTDLMRITLDMGNNGHENAKIMLENGIMYEHADERYIILLATPFHTDSDFEILKNAILKLKPGNIKKVLNQEIPKQICTPREALIAKKEIIAIKNSINKTAGETISKCPPGIPITVAGEKISEETIKNLVKIGKETIVVIK